MMPFSDIHISQGSVVTRLGCGGVFIHHFVTNFLVSLTVKNLKNRLIFGEVMGKSFVSCFFESWCSIFVLIIITIIQVCIEPALLALNVTLNAFAAERRHTVPAVHPQLSISPAHRALHIMQAAPIMLQK